MDERRVCYTEDSAPWAGFVTEVFTAFGFKVQHFETNDEAWENPETGIQKNPDLYDVYVFDNDTGPYSAWEGVDLIQEVVKLKTKPDRKLLIIFLSSSNPGLFVREDVAKLRRDHKVELCYKPHTFALQAAFASDKLDNWDMVGSFDSWLRKTRGVDPEDSEAVSRENNLVQTEARRRKRSA